MESVNYIPLKVETYLLPVWFFRISLFTLESPSFLKNEMKRGKGSPTSFRAHWAYHKIWKSEHLSLCLDPVALPWKGGKSSVSRDFLRHFVCVPQCLNVRLAGRMPEWAALWAFSLASPLCMVTWKINTVKIRGEALFMYEVFQYL